MIPALDARGESVLARRSRRRSRARARLLRRHAPAGRPWTAQRLAGREAARVWVRCSASSGRPGRGEPDCQSLAAGLLVPFPSRRDVKNSARFLNFRPSPADKTVCKNTTLYSGSLGSGVDEERS